MYKLVECRKKAGLTQKEAAEKLGISFVTLSNYENGKREPMCNTLIAMHELYECSIDMLLGLESTDQLTISTEGISESGVKEIENFAEFKRSTN